MELEKLQKIAEVLNVDTEEVTWDTTFVDDLGRLSGYFPNCDGYRGRI